MPAAGCSGLEFDIFVRAEMYDLTWAHLIFALAQ